MQYLSVIITFANEQAEVERTLKSIRRNSPVDLPIILVNDASDDGYNYDFLQFKYNVTYIKNEVRLGVAKSRDLGVENCKTPYFILLDAHMRFYDDTWYSAIVNQLEKNSKILLCCQTRNIRKTQKEKKFKPIGAIIVFDSETNTFDPVWNFTEKCPESPIERIPCVLGATYATSKTYWLHLKGLSGLLSYGGDEQYISMKVWREGGKCIVLKNIIVGHLYRKKHPYNFNDVDFLYNKMLICELVMSTTMKSRIISALKSKYSLYQDIFIKAYTMLVDNKKEINRLKDYYQSIFKYDFDSFYEFNKSFFVTNDDLTQQEKEIDDIAMNLIMNIEKANLGLLNGLMAYSLFFFHYSRYTGNTFFEDIAESLLNKIYDGIDLDSPMGLGNGLCGIGWGIEYLLQNKFIEGSADDVLAEIDDKLLAYNLNKISDYSLSTGLAGYLSYIFIRLSKQSIHDNIPFENSFLDIAKSVADIIISKRDAFEGVNVALQLSALLQGDHIDYNNPSIDDLLYASHHTSINNEEYSMFGMIGRGINLMLAHNEK